MIEKIALGAGVDKAMLLQMAKNAEDLVERQIG